MRQRGGVAAKLQGWHVLLVRRLGAQPRIHVRRRRQRAGLVRGAHCHMGVLRVAVAPALVTTLRLLLVRLLVQLLPAIDNLPYARLDSALISGNVFILASFYRDRPTRERF